MISGIAMTFVILPCCGAVGMAAVLRDWRLAAAAFCGALGLMFVAPVLPAIVRLIGLPIVAGATMGAATATVGLWFRPSVDIWSRMIWALVATAAVCFSLLAPFLIGS